jgi:beta-glucuronidase
MYARHVTRIVHQLDGMWDFVFLGDVSPDSVDPASLTFDDRLPVPSAFDAFPAYAGRRGVGVYRLMVRCTPQTAGRLFFGAVSFWGRVFVDGRPVGEHSGGYTGFWLDAPATEHSVRELVVVTDNRFDAERAPLHEPYYDFYQYGGLLRTVEWHEVPDSYLQSAVARTVETESGRLTLHLTFGGSALAAAQVTVALDDGPSVPFDLAVRDGEADLALTVPDPQPWSPATPALHRLTIGYGQDDWILKVGLRTVGTRDGSITVNGAPVKLLGYCRHEAHPQFGPALPLAQLVADLQLLRDLGCNFVRGAHYPQDQRFLDLCDEMGFLVWEEGLGWQQDERHFTSAAYAQAHASMLDEMVSLSINHPSVVMWGFLNEGRSDLPAGRPLYEDSFRLIRRLDPTRLVSHATNHPADDLHLGLADVVSVNAYPGWYDDLDADRPLDLIVPGLRGLIDLLAERGYGDVPLLLSEIGAEGLWGWRDALNGFWTEEFQADYLATVCREVVGNDRIAGVSLWQFHDARTYQGPRAVKRARAFNNKGTVDEYRRPKAAYAAVREIFQGSRRGEADPTG